MRAAISIYLICVTGVLCAQPLRLEKTIPLPGVEKKLDRLAIDVSGNRLFLAASGNNTVEVIDLDSGRDVRRLQGMREPRGILYWAARNRLYVANAGDGHVKVYDGTSFQQIADYDFNGGEADQIRVDPKHSEVFVGYGNGAIGIIDADLHSAIQSIFLKLHPGSFQLEAEGHRIFVNIPGGVSSLVKQGYVAVIDRRTRSVTGKWAIDGAVENYPIALDETNRRLFVGCRKPSKLIVLDTGSGRQIASVDIAGEADDLFYDAALKRIYASGGAGAVTVIQQKDADRYQPLATIPTARGAGTSLFVPELMRLYVAVPHRGKQQAEVLVFSVFP